MSNIGREIYIPYDCNSDIPRSSYRVEAEGYDWAVLRSDTVGLALATFKNAKEKESKLNEWERNISDDSEDEDNNN